MKRNKPVVKQMQDILDDDALGETYLVSALNYYAKEVMADESDWGNAIFTKQEWQAISQRLLNTLPN